VSHARPRGPIVIDTDVFSADLVPGAPLTDRYAPIIAGRPVLISFQTAAELRYGALRRGWGEARMLRLEANIQRAEIVHTGPELVLVYARLRANCEARGHALAQRAHSADRWIAATAIRLGCRWSPTTRSSATRRIWRSSRRPSPEVSRLRAAFVDWLTADCMVGLDDQAI
jgi:predicted nucleic acid-binding protein